METDEKIAVACGVLIVLIILLAALFSGKEEALGGADAGFALGRVYFASRFATPF